MAKMVEIGEEELASLRRDAARFRAEQERAWQGLPEYNIITFWTNKGEELREEEFKAARAAHIDTTIPR